MTWWMELVLFDDHGVVSVVLWLLAVGEQQLVCWFDDWTFSTIRFRFWRKVLRSCFASIFWWYLTGNSMWRAHYDTVLLILHWPCRAASLRHTAYLLIWTISAWSLIFCVFHAVFRKLLTNARFLRVRWSTRDSRAIDCLIISIMN